VELLDARIGGLYCTGATLNNLGGNALHANDAEIAGGVFLRPLVPRDGQDPLPCRVTGEVRLPGAHVGAGIHCTGAILSNEGGQALTADDAEIAGGVFIKACRVTGEVRLAGARIRGGLICTAATLNNPVGKALTADDAEIAGGLYLRSLVPKHGVDPMPCEVTGEVRLAGARISGGLYCTGATLSNPGGKALTASNAEIAGGLYLRPDSKPVPKDDPGPRAHDITGEVRLAGARISGKLDCTGAAITPVVDLRGCRVSELVDDLALSENCWSEVELHLDGFTYERFGRNSTWDHRARFKWLRRTPGYGPGPWEQLQRVYVENGHDKEARLTGIEKQKDRLDRGELSHPQKAWRLLLGATVGHGYRPALAGLWALGLIIVLSGLVWAGRADLTHVGTGSAAPAQTVDGWTAFAYAVDTFLPVADFNVSDQWRARGWLEPARFGFVVLGWLLGTIFVAGFTAVVRSQPQR